MNNWSQLQENAIQRTLDLLSQAIDHFSLSRPKITILFDLRGTTAGQVRSVRKGNFEIRYNLQLLTENPDSFLLRTLPHEVAHVIVYCLYGRRAKPHGNEWKSVMSFFNADASRCHSYDVSASRRRRLQRFTYQCGCRDHEITSIRHNRIQRGQIYQCVYCKEPLQPALSD